jgi:hypothetical protein
MAGRTFYRKPDGHVVTDFDEYHQAWQAIIKPAERLLGTTCLGFDPGATFRPPEGTFAESVNLPVWALLNIAANLKKRKGLRRT